MIFIRRKHRPFCDQALIINGQAVPRVDHVRFLGVNLDYKLKGDIHFKHLIKKGNAIINILSSLAGVWWDSHLQLLFSEALLSMTAKCLFGTKTAQFSCD